MSGSRKYYEVCSRHGDEWALGFRTVGLRGAQERCTSPMGAGQPLHGSDPARAGPPQDPNHTAGALCTKTPFSDGHPTFLDPSFSLLHRRAGFQVRRISLKALITIQAAVEPVSEARSTDQYRQKAMRRPRSRASRQQLLKL